MKQTLLIWAATLFGVHAYGGEVIMECGRGSDNNFNGWYIHPHSVFEGLNFYDSHVEFVSNSGGDYSISLSRKIPEMSDYSNLQIEFHFETIENCRLNNITVYMSRNGEDWEAVQQEATNSGVEIENPDLDYEYVKAVANVTFYANGKISWDYAKIEGDYTLSMEEQPLRAREPEDDFYIYSYNKVINIECRTEEDYTVLVTNLAGQIQYHESGFGSERIEADYPPGIYIVHIIKDFQMVTTRKVAL